MTTRLSTALEFRLHPNFKAEILIEVHYSPESLFEIEDRIKIHGVLQRQVP